MLIRYPLASAMLAVALITSPGARAAGEISWGYSGAHSPEHWASDFPWCGGYQQSPVNIAAPVAAELPALTMNYQPSTLDVVNNGHTVQFNYRAGSTLTVNGSDYALLQFHFHSPSENQVQGHNFPMEGHLVHRNADRALAVVAILFTEGETNAQLETLWAGMPMAPGDTVSDDSVSYSIADLLPPDADYYRFAGSLTTPPCTEGVTWLVMKTPVVMSAEQLAHFRKAMGGHDTNRPVQPLNARLVME